MTKYLRLLILCTLIVSLLTACRKQKGFPIDSNSGSNVFGCYINGKEFIPCAKFEWRTKSIGENISSGLPYSVSITAQNECEKSYPYGRFIRINFDSINIQENKTYKFGGPVACTYAENIKYFYSDSALTGSMTIRRFDPQKKILSANFDVVVKLMDSARIVTVTNGTFDVTLW